ncbi:MAG: hypothetical protein M3Z31_06295 [Pseudomonadota bacterium]|nr:hypothetical protein [Pseudomonadota bacterium]
MSDRTPALAPDPQTLRGRPGLPPLAVAQIIARNIVPLAGVLFFGWRTGSVVLLYFVDTMLAITVLIGGLMSVYARDDPAGALLNNASVVAAALFTAAFLAIPLGAPVLILLASNDVHWQDLVNDPGIRTGLAMQAVTALWSYIGFSRALRVATPEQLRVKRRFALVFLRWVGVMMVMFSSIAMYLPVLVIAAYVALSIWEEIAPDHFLRAAGDVEDAASTDAATATAEGSAPRPRGLLRRSRRHRS